MGTKVPPSSDDSDNKSRFPANDHPGHTLHTSSPTLILLLFKPTAHICTKEDERKC
jgi:hypothetical protein